MAESTFDCSVITPERIVLQCKAKFVAFPAHDGELGVLRNRAPLVCKMGIGVLRVEADNASHQYFVDGGFAQVVDNKLSILTAQARAPKDVDSAAANKAMVEARAMDITDDASFEARQNAVKRAQVQLKLAGK